MLYSRLLLLRACTISGLFYYIKQERRKVLVYALHLRIVSPSVYSYAQFTLLFGEQNDCSRAPKNCAPKISCFSCTIHFNKYMCIYRDGMLIYRQDFEILFKHLEFFRCAQVSVRSGFLYKTIYIQTLCFICYAYLFTYMSTGFFLSKKHTP